MKIVPSHVAILVRSVRKAADHLAQFGFQIGPEDSFEGEGTREIYIEYGKSNSLLLMEPAGPGSYERAMKKRGPGLHHMAIDIPDLESYIESLSGTGWLLHPMSVHTMKHKTAYLARPGFPGLIEVQERSDIQETPVFVSEVAIPLDPALNRLLKPVGLDAIVRHAGSPHLKLGNHVIPLSQLL